MLADLRRLYPESNSRFGDSRVEVDHLRVTGHPPVSALRVLLMGVVSSPIPAVDSEFNRLCG